MDNTVEVQVQELGKVMVTNRGEYISSKSYEILDIVSYNGSSFMSKIDDNTSVPAEEISPDELLINENWQLVAKKGDTYKVTEEDLQAIAKQITDNAKSAFNQNVETKTKEFNTNVTNKLNDYDTNAKSTTETFDANAKKKLDEYNANDTKKLKAYNDNADNKLSAYNTNDTNKLKAYNTNADSKIEEYNVNANSKITEYDEHAEELRNMAISTDNELERIKNGMLGTGSASDTFIHIEDSCMAKLKELEIEGVCEQETTSGKNLLNVAKDLLQIKSDSYSITPVYSNGMLKYIELNGTFDEWKRYSILGAEFTLSTGTYTQSFHKEGTFSDGSVYIDSSLSITSIESDNFSKVLDEDLNVLKYSVCVNKGTICNNLRLYPMIAKEEKVSNYEPFTNGTSPNLDYPQEIKTITDSLKITSNNKNLFKITSPLKQNENSGVNVSINDNIVTLNGTATGAIWPDFIWGIQANTVAHKKCNYYFSEQLEDCIASIRVLNGTATGGSFVIVANDDGSSTFGLKFSDLQSTKVFKANGINRAFLSGITAGTKFDNFTFEIMLEKGNVVTSFEKNVESLIEVGLPEGEFIGKLNDTYKDTLTIEYIAEDSKCHLKLNKKVGFKNFNDVSSILYSVLQGDYFLFQIATDYLPSSIMISNNFINKGNYGSNYNYESIFRGGTNNNAFQFKIKKERVASYDAEGALSFIKNSNTDVYYALNTPYTLELGTIDMPLSYKEITHIFTDSELFPKINAKYYRTFEKTVQNMQIDGKALKQEITDLNVSLADVIKRLETLESANASTVEESEASNDLQN